MIKYFWMSIQYSIILLFGSTGETVIEKSGHLNLGIPGIMCCGAVGALFGETWYLSLLNGDTKKLTVFGVIMVGLIFSILFAGLMGLLYGFLTITLRCNQNVSGLIITTFGAGLYKSYGGMLTSRSSFRADFALQSSMFATKIFPFYEDLGWFGEIFLKHGLLPYVAIIVSLLIQLILKKTRIGLNLRAVGENPAAADAAGINVTKYKYFASVLGAAFSGLGGAYYLMEYCCGSVEYEVEAMGWLAVALVIFSLWRPNLGILGAYIFALLSLAPNYLNLGINQEIYKMLPYVVTLVVLVIISIRNSKANQPPASLGISYFREER